MRRPCPSSSPATASQRGKVAADHRKSRRQFRCRQSPRGGQFITQSAAPEAGLDALPVGCGAPPAIVGGTVQHAGQQVGMLLDLVKRIVIAAGSES